MKKSVEERFWKKVDRSGGKDACWLWLAGFRKKGQKYGAFYIRERKNNVPAHNIAFLLMNGYLSKGKIIMHSCDNPPCCNPAHLFEGTPKDNSDDKVKKGRQSKGLLHSLALMKNRPSGNSHYSRINPEKLARGETHGLAKLTPEIVMAIRKEYVPRKISSIFLAQKYNIDPSNVMCIVHRKTWVHI